MYQGWNNSLAKAIGDLFDSVKNHLCFWRVGCFLWWLGGLFTPAQIRLNFLESAGMMPAGFVLTTGMAHVYFLSLAFCFAYKKAEKSSNGDHGRDRYKGEVWVVAWLIFYSSLQYDLSTSAGSFKILGYFGAVNKMPALLDYTMYGVMAAWGVTRLGRVGEMIKSIFPEKIKQLFS